MGTTIFVGNLAFSTTQDDVLAVFRLVGNVISCKLVTDHLTQRSRGFAFVEMSSRDQASRAIADFDGKELDGRILTVREARPRSETQHTENSFAHAGRLVSSFRR